MRISIIQHVLISIMVISILVLAWQLIGIRATTLEQFRESAYDLYTWVHNHYIFALILYCCTFILAAVSAFPITVVFTIAGGFLFGPIIGAIYAVACATTGAVVVFLLSRYLLGKRVQKRYAQKLDLFNVEIKRHGQWYILMAHVFPFTPMFIMNVSAGLTNISLWTYSWATALGLIPGTLLYTFAGQYVHKIDSVADIVSWQMFWLLILGSLLLLLPVVWHYSKKYFNARGQ